MRRLRFAEWMMLAGAAGLIVTLFMDWYALDYGRYFHDLLGGSATPSVEGINRRDIASIGMALQDPASLHTTGWSALGWPVIVLLVACVAAGLLLFALIAAGAGDAYTLPPGVILVTLGIPALLVLLIVVLLQPGLGAGLPNDAVRLEPAGWIGIGCAILLVAGGMMSLRDERTTGPERVYVPPPARPAPPA